MSIPDQIQSYRWPAYLKTTLELTLARLNMGKPGTWMRNVATEQLMLLQGNELLKAVGFSRAYHALEHSPSASSSEEAVGFDAASMAPRTPIICTHSQRQTFQERVLELLASVGPHEVMSRLRQGHVQFYQTRKPEASADNVFFRQQDSGSVNK